MENFIKCRSCDNTFTKYNDLQKHTILCRKKNLTCRVCEKEFSVTKELMLHLRSRHINHHEQEEKVITKEISKVETKKTEISNQEYTCKVCNEGFHDIEKLIHHLRNHIETIETENDATQSSSNEILFENELAHPKMQSNEVDLVHNKSKKYNCQACNERLRTKEKLEIHVDLVHKKLKNYECDQCNKRFGLKANLERHIDLVHKKLRKHKCDKCKKRFGLNSHLRIHIDVVHNKIKNYECDKCPKRFGTKSNLQAHTELIHDNLKNHVKNYKSTLKKKSQCDKCHKNCKDLYQHKRIVHDRKESKECDTCGKTLASKIAFQNHMLIIHNDERFAKYSCQICDKKFIFQSLLTFHVTKFHVKGASVKCDVCNKTFASDTGLYTHVKTIHEKDKQYKCDSCGNHYAQKGQRDQSSQKSSFGY